MISHRFPPFSNGLQNIPESFIREILKVSSQPDMISFAGGLPNPEFFPVEKIAEAADKVLTRDGKAALQYWVTEGYMPLRDYVANWQSQRMGMTIDPESILILNGSQQGLDLIGKLFLNPMSRVLLEGPSYLGAIQAFSAYQPDFHHVPIQSGGPDLDKFASTMKHINPLLYYCVPKYQNPTGNRYDDERINGMAKIMKQFETILVEDNPYSEICFQTDNVPNFLQVAPEMTVHLGSFSKIVSPGLRLGWATGPKAVIRKMSVAKQASDLHSNTFAQRIIYQFLMDNPLNEHLNNIRSFYRNQAKVMLKSMHQHFPDNVSYIEPTGGMFIWVTMPEGLNSRKLLEKAITEKVLFVPGDSFYVNSSGGTSSFRMNFSNPTQMQIEKGIQILGRLMKAMMSA